MGVKTAGKLVLVLAASFVWSLGAAGPGAAASGGGAKGKVLPTARVGLAAAAAEAKKWQADAVLTYVSTDTAEPDGRAYTWMYLYESPKTKQQTAVLVDEKGEVSLLPTSGMRRTPLGEFIDSDRAMAAAVASGMKTHAFGMKMSLSAGERSEWFMSDKDFGYTIDAVTGRLLEKE